MGVYLSLACLLARPHARAWSLLFTVQGFLSAQIGVLERVGYHRAPVLGLGGCSWLRVEGPQVKKFVRQKEMDRRLENRILQWVDFDHTSTQEAAHQV